MNSLQNKYLKQNTPKGEIILKYNNLNSSFDYYCKKSNSIDFPYLDVVSRIYVVKNNCKKIYFDNYDNYEIIKDFNCKEEETLSVNASRNSETNSIFYNGQINQISQMKLLSIFQININTKELLRNFTAIVRIKNIKLYIMI